MKKNFYRIIGLTIIIAHLFTFCFRDINFAHAAGTPALPVQESTQASLANSAESEQINNAAGFNVSSLQSLQNEPYTGRVSFSLPILVPAGRKGIRPNVALAYSSGSGNGILGVGWNLKLDSIQRSTKKGAPKYNDTQDIFVFSSGSSQELVKVATGEYRPKIESAFSKFLYDGTSWQVIDKSGTKYYFGSAGNSKQAGAAGTFSWYLNRVVDIHGNFMDIEYAIDNNQIYPSKIKYTGNEVTAAPPLYEIEFILEDRPDSSINYRSGIKVTTAKRLKQINVKYNSALVRQYKIDYLPLTNLRLASLIEKVTLYGADGVSSLAPLVFTYREFSPVFSATRDWPINTGGVLSGSQNLRAYSSNDTIALIADMNADGLPDRVLRKNGSAFYVQLNNGNSFSAPVEWGPILPDSYAHADAIEWYNGGLYKGQALFDINGDSLPDRVLYSETERYYKAQINTGSGFESSFTPWGVPSSRSYFSEGYDSFMGLALGPPTGLRSDLCDLNADGLIDRVMSDRYGDSNFFDAQLNNGSSFSGVQAWPIAWAGDSRSGDEGWSFVRLTSGGGVTAVLLDINGDGLPDRILRKNSAPYDSFDVQLNTGSGFDSAISWGPLLDGEGFIERASGSAKDLALMDINADGLPDRIFLSKQDNKYKVQLNTGSGFAQATIDLANDIFDSVGDTNNADVFDINGDGFIDKVMATGGASFNVRLSDNPQPPNHLTKVENGIGGAVEITYKAYKGADNTTYDPQKLLPFPVWAVDTIIQKTGEEEAGRVSYSYDSGYFDSAGREFRGFGYVKAIDAEGNYTESFFLQDDIYKGKLYKQEIKDKDARLYAKTENVWASREVYPGVNFAYLEKSDSYTYDVDTTFKQTRSRFEYDAYGNPARVISDGDVEVTGDEKTQVTDYNYNTAKWLLSCPMRSYITDSRGTELQRKNFVYDGQTNTYDLPIKGMVTLIEAQNVKIETGEAIDRNVTLYAYDSFGNLTTVTDNYDFTTRTGQTTTTHYDRVMSAYPFWVENALGKIASYAGYYAIEESDFRGFGLPGQVEYTEDANYQRTYNIYDTLGRLIKVVGPLDSKDYPGIIYEYDLSVQPVKITKRVKADYNTPPNYYISYQFYDGLGRLIETKSPAQDEPGTGARRQIISDIVKFDSRGKVKEKYLSYFTVSSPNYLTPTYGTPNATFTYDVLGRLTQTTNPDGTYQTISYSDWVTTITDENSHYKTTYRDAYGRITKVEDHNSTQVYTTTYEYDVFGNLTKVIDNAGNTTQAWYDAYGRKLKMIDPDMGEWSYKYDPLGNLKEQTDAKRQTLSFDYDAINRLRHRQHIVSADNIRILATYNYDNRDMSGINTCLSHVDDSLGGRVAFAYDRLGRETIVTKLVDGGYYTVIRDYDALGRVVRLRYPAAGFEIQYEYSPQGIDKVYNQDRDGTKHYYVSGVEYSPNGQITKIKYANGTETNYRYNPQTLRLDNLTTQSPAGKIQDFTYTFDGAGNIRNITDAVNTATQAFIYDDLGRLKAATGSYGTLNYDYDSIGNMTLKDGQTLIYGREGAGRLPHTATRVDGIAIDYDENGNMISKGNMVFSYDVENRLVKAEDTSSSILERIVVIELRPGWNFFSLPVTLANSSIAEALSSISGKYDQVSRYNPATRGLQQYVGNPKYDQFTSLEYGKGYQIYITDSAGARLTVTGQLPKTSTVTLSRGHNLIFCPKVMETPVEQALLPLRLGAEYSKVLRYNKDLGAYEEYSREKKEFNNLKPGEAYYLYTTGNTTTWNIANPDLGVTTFAYDAYGSRVKKVTQAGSTLYIGLLFETDSLGNYANHIFAGSQRVCSIDALSGIEQKTIRYYHPDYLGSSNVITDKDGIRVSLSEFTPFGSTFKQEGAYESHYKFTGKELDSSTGLYFDGENYYDPDLGVFITH